MLASLLQKKLRNFFHLRCYDIKKKKKNYCMTNMTNRLFIANMTNRLFNQYPYNNKQVKFVQTLTNKQSKRQRNLRRDWGSHVKCAYLRPHCGGFSNFFFRIFFKKHKLHNLIKRKFYILTTIKNKIKKRKCIKLYNIKLVEFNYGYCQYC